MVCYLLSFGVAVAVGGGVNAGVIGVDDAAVFIIFFEEEATEFFHVALPHTPPLPMLRSPRFQHAIKSPDKSHRLLGSQQQIQ